MSRPMAPAADPRRFPLVFTAYGNPATAGSKIAGVSKTGKRFVRDSSGNAGREWRKNLVAAAGERMAGRELYTGPLVVNCVFYLPRPKAHYGARGLRPSAPAHPTVNPDTTKLFRAVEDALTGVVWRDDSQVVTQVVEKRYGEPARVEVSVGPKA